MLLSMNWLSVEELSVLKTKQEICSGLSTKQLFSQLIVKDTWHVVDHDLFLDPQGRSCDILEVLRFCYMLQG